MNTGIEHINEIGQCSKEQIDNLSSKITQSVKVGNISAIDVLSKIKKIEYLCAEIKKNTKEDVLFELDNYDKEFRLNGVLFIKGSIRTEYDFSNCNHIEYEQIKHDIEQLNAKRKEIEGFLKAIVGKDSVMDSEGNVINQPMKKVTDGVKLSFK